MPWLIANSHTRRSRKREGGGREEERGEGEKRGDTDFSGGL